MGRKEKITKRKVELEVSFIGNGTIVEKRSGVFSGGVADPNIEGNMDFKIWEEFPQEDGTINPDIGSKTYQGALQIVLSGNSEGYRELAKYLLAIAEMATGNDTSFHEHLMAVNTEGRTRLDIMVRKPNRSTDGEDYWGI